MHRKKTLRYGVTCPTVELQNEMAAVVLKQSCVFGIHVKFNDSWTPFLVLCGVFAPLNLH